MDGRSPANTVSLVLVAGGVAALAAASAFVTNAAYSDLLIVAGLDALTIGVAGQLLLRIFPGQKRPARAATLQQSARSIDNSDAYELKIALLQHLSREDPVFVSFPPEDTEATDFARQIAGFLDENGFRIVGFAPGSSSVALRPGVGFDGNRIIVGPSSKAVAPKGSS